MLKFYRLKLLRRISLHIQEETDFNVGQDDIDFCTQHWYSIEYSFGFYMYSRREWTLINRYDLISVYLSHVQQRPLHLSYSYWFQGFQGYSMQNSITYTHILHVSAGLHICSRCLVNYTASPTLIYYICKMVWMGHL